MKCKTCVTAVFLLFLTVLVSFSASNAQDIKSTLLIGIAEVNYTPAVGLDMAGNYRGNDYASRGIHDSLYARAIVAANEKGEKAALLTVDICYIPRGNCRNDARIYCIKDDHKTGQCNDYGNPHA